MVLINIVPPGGVAKIIETLGVHGYEAYAAGGCIRDAVMGREPKDWDIATDAHPAEVRRLFEKTVDTGIKHGTVTVVLDNKNYEVTTFRIDGRYTDGRHPDRVEFTSGIGEDLRRRDFTINAMAWNPQKGIIDPFGGMRDISRRIIRTVGSPSDRFGEDALRMLRAVRFASVLGFEIETDTLEGIRQNSSLISWISAERIREELTAVLVSDDPMKFMLLSDTGLLRHIMPELDACSSCGGRGAGPGGGHACTGEHLLHSVAAVGKDRCLRWAMRLHDAGRCSGSGCEGTAEIILRRLKFDNKSRNRILRIIKYLDMRIEPERPAVARAVLKAGTDVFADLLKAKRAHLTAVKKHGGRDDPAQQQDQPDTGRDSAGAPYHGRDFRKTANGLCQLESVEAIFRFLLENGYCLSLKDLDIDGNDLKRLGFSGEEIGKALDHLLERVIDEPELNEKEILEKLALEYMLDQASISNDPAT